MDMGDLSEQVQRLTREEPEVQEILRTFAELDQLYREAIQAVSATEPSEPAVKNSAQVRISFRSTPPDSTDTF
jgi:hypothetical protein